jgi:hypothetical protein
MTQQQRPPSPSREDRISLAIDAIQKKRVSKHSRVAALHTIPRTTLRRRLQGALPQAIANAQK